MTQQLLIGLDVGTTGARAVAITANGGVAAEANAPYPLLTPRPAWSEQNPRDWVQASRTVLRSVAMDAGGEVAGLGLTGQMHGAVFLDAADQVIRRRCSGTTSARTSSAWPSRSSSAGGCWRSPATPR